MTLADSADQVNSPAAALPEIEQTYLGRWHQLVSTTNWEKGRIIHEWRAALIEAGAPQAEYTDEVWSQRVGGVTSQHVGRLRRVFQRFGESQEKYDRLFWSHFQAALDWEDAEMWLEGAVQNDWSVSQMRRTRWETLGAVESEAPQEADIVTSEVDEDFTPASADAEFEESSERGDPHFDSQPAPEGPDFGDADEVSDYSDADASDGEPAAVERAGPPVRPFEHLAELPVDLADAFDAFKIAILRHKGEGWSQISCDEVVASLDALKELARAPSDEYGSVPESTAQSG